MIPGVNLARNVVDFAALMLGELGRAMQPRPVEIVDEVSLPGLPHRDEFTPIPARDERAADA